ncbi:hypothetical protein FACS1894188_07890 [Clostridia bacterium]|nr:hypothetical protein FACS1894188_07890 [Clostridia bacterium]
MASNGTFAFSDAYRNTMLSKNYETPENPQVYKTAVQIPQTYKTMVQVQSNTTK